MAESFFLTYRRTAVVLTHVGLWAVAFLGAFLLRWEFAIPDRYFPQLWSWLAVLVGLRVSTGFVFGIFHGMWRYTGANDLVGLFKATSLSTLAFAAFVLGVRYEGFPRSVFIIDWLASMMLVGGLRFGIRKLREVGGEIRAARGKRSRILILGAGDAGESLVREIQRNAKSKYIPVGFLDDDPRKRGMEIHGLKVLGPIADVAEATAHHEVDEIIVAIPTASGAEMRAILERTKPLHAHVRTIPGVDQLLDGRVTVNQIREVAIEDLLGRDPIDLEEGTIAHAVKGSVVMVSGAGGSIGSELCRQVCRFLPKKLVLVERTENNLFLIHRELRQTHPEVDLVPCVCDVSDEDRVDSVFDRHRPSVVFHAAAHKHVPMMEWNPGEAIKNNVRGTRVFAEASDRHGVRRFVMVSTDKAVNPTSVMGVSKRAAEIFVQNLGRRSKTRFVTVRFGNVLGSAGSVIPIFKQQIADGGPVTVTHPEMTRYFMTIPEASQLVLQAGAMGEGSEIFILDMGEPVKIVDLANDLISLSGLTPGEDIEIQFTGMRPGEKLFEELSVKEEAAHSTRHPKIFIGKVREYEDAAVREGLKQLEARADTGDARELKGLFRRLIPEYDPDPHGIGGGDADAGERHDGPGKVVPLRA
jgi:FlaA1/EpsC-like NDP-sugar epimerase